MNKGPDGKELIYTFIKPGVLPIAQDLAAQQGYEEIAHKIIQNIDNYIETMKDLYTASNNSGYKVLCHGDFHSKNMLIRNKGKTDEDLLLVSIPDNFLIQVLTVAYLK